MTNKRDQFIIDRIPHHLAKIQAQYPDVREGSLSYWATDAAEKEWRTGRVYDYPAEVMVTEISIYDPEESFTSGRTQGFQLRTNPGGPMVSLTNMSFAEGKELALALITALKAVDCWTAEDEAEIYDDPLDESIVRNDKDYTRDHPAGEPLERAVEPSAADPLA